MTRTQRARAARRGVVAALVLLALAAGCDSAGDTGTPGDLSVRLDTPNTDDGAILFEVNGPGITNPVAVGTIQLFSAPAGSSQLRVAVVGNLTDGVVMTFTVPDIGAAASYSATIVEVARQDNTVRAATGYTLAVEP